MDLNADLAEGDTFGPRDRALLDVVTSASLACGFHAGSRTVMRAAAESCIEQGVAIGAHVSYRDRVGFGRWALDLPAGQLSADLVEQWEALVTEVTAAGGEVTFVKPHGALYAAMAVDRAVATTVVDTFAPRCPVLVGPPDGTQEGAAVAAGMDMVPEGFCDRGYDASGLLIPRGEAGDLVDDPAVVAGRARSLTIDSGVHAVDGTWVALRVRTLCIHGDRDGADSRARAVRDALAAAGVEVRAFAPAVDT
ncbi:MAG TPA: 5-oxoprolinase subunit PxpA [Acidimicrobiales bacterium]